MQKTFETCVEFYGESVKTAQPNVFFSKLTQFVNNFKKCKAENDQRKLIEKVSDYYFLNFRK